MVVVAQRGTGDLTTHGFRASFPASVFWRLSAALRCQRGETWPAAAASFLGMWVVMMVAMMLPSFVPALLGYRRLLGEAHGRRLGTPTLLAGVGYFLVWAGAGADSRPPPGGAASNATKGA